MGTRPRPRQAAAAAAGGDGAWEARTGPRQTQMRCHTPATARLRRGSPLTTLQPTKRKRSVSGDHKFLNSTCGPGLFNGCFFKRLSLTGRVSADVV